MKVVARQQEHAVFAPLEALALAARTPDRRRATTLRDSETKQVEFIRAPGVGTKQIYIYDGVKIDANRYNGWDWDNIRNDHSYGAESNPKVWVMREFVNSQANRLGMPLPKGRVRFYRRNDDGQIEFTGENTIEHFGRTTRTRILRSPALREASLRAECMGSSSG